MEKHTLVVRNVVAIRNSVATIVSIPRQNIDANAQVNMREQHVGNGNCAFSVEPSLDVPPLEFFPAIELKRLTESIG